MACAVKRIVLVWLAAGLLWLAFGPSPSQAATMRGNVEICSSFGATVYDVGQMRDSGIPWETFGPWIIERVANALTDPRSYIKDAEDVSFVLDWFKRVYDSPNTEALELAITADADCMKTPAAFKHGKKLT